MTDDSPDADETREPGDGSGEYRIGELAVDPDEVDDLPTISCSLCDREWDLSYELDDLGVGNQAAKQFALDHKRHTGHYPDGVATWRAACRQCVESTEHLSADAARRWAKIHARHTRHSVDLRHATDDESSRIEPDE